jgi:hypothetical protein
VAELAWLDHRECLVATSTGEEAFGQSTPGVLARRNERDSLPQELLAFGFLVEGVVLPSST